MPRLIDANAIYEAVEQRYKISSGIEHRCERALLDLICAEDTVDAAEVVHSRWEVECRNRKKCSNCGFSRNTDTQLGWNYCPNCGAKMDSDSTK